MNRPPFGCSRPSPYRLGAAGTLGGDHPGRVGYVVHAPDEGRQTGHRPFDPRSGSHPQGMDGSHYLPILIGPFEATAIALALEGAPVPRPLSHDLMRNILETLNANLEQVVIHDIKDSTFFAKLVVRTNGDIKRSTPGRPTTSRSRCGFRRRSSSPTRSCSRRRRPKRSPSTTTRWHASRSSSTTSNHRTSTDKSLRGRRVRPVLHPVRSGSSADAGGVRRRLRSAGRAGRTYRRCRSAPAKDTAPPRDRRGSGEP